MSHHHHHRDGVRAGLATILVIIALFAVMAFFNARLHHHQAELQPLDWIEPKAEERGHINAEPSPVNEPRIDAEPAPPPVIILAPASEPRVEPLFRLHRHQPKPAVQPPVKVEQPTNEVIEMNPPAS